MEILQKNEERKVWHQPSPIFHRAKNEKFILGAHQKESGVLCFGVMLFHEANMERRDPQTAVICFGIPPSPAEADGGFA